MRHHDQSCDRARHWTSVACVSECRSFRRVSFSCLSYVRCLSCMCLLTVRRDSPGCLSRERHRSECHSSFAVLGVTRILWLECLVRVARLPRYINGVMPYASMLCIARYPSVARNQAKVSCIQFKTRQGNVWSPHKEVVLIRV